MKSFLLLISSIWATQLIAQMPNYTELYRPRFHFSPASNWCNDPNGLVYNNGTYHLFYQHNPFENKWGHMTWAHATSKDLVHWQHQPIAIPEENGTMIFSGTCVVDNNNTSGFGKNGKAPMVAVYTGHIENVNQSQCIAYSNDDGLTWTKYANNPVLDLHKKDFRDPKIFWYAPKQYWVMALMFPVEHLVQFYQSKNLKDWTHLSNFGPVGDTSGVWECPDLTQVPIAGVPSKQKWLLQTSQNASMQYFVGEFDGTTFTNENTINNINRPDYGPDYYAAIAYNQLPKNDLPTSIGWVNNWNYANDIPTAPWKSAMSIPRNLSVIKNGTSWELLQSPIKALQTLRAKAVAFKNEKVVGKKILPFTSNQFEMEVNIAPNKNSVAGVRLAVSDSTYFEIGYDVKRQTLYIDRSKSGNNTFNENYKNLHRFEKKIILNKKNILSLHLFFDHSIVEVFANDGAAVFTAQLFTAPENNKIEIFSTNGAIFSNIVCWKLNSIWKH